MPVLSGFERPVEPGNPIGIDDEFDGACPARDAADEAPLLQPNEHRIYGRGREVEKALEVGVTGSHSGLIPHHVFTDECEKLSLLAGWAVRRRCGWRSFGAGGF